MGPVPRHFGGRLMMHRERMGVTRIWLAEAIDCPLDSLRDWEKGVRFPKVDTFIKLCTILDVSADWLLDLDTPPVHADEYRALLTAAFDRYISATIKPLQAQNHALKKALMDAKQGPPPVNPSNPSIPIKPTT